jgi:hypothetical protein
LLVDFKLSQGFIAPMPKRDSIPTTRDKALSLNLDKSTYGTFAEIGAGQETAAWFFRVGGASGTVAKTISAYDMQMSDAIYGTSPRYVSRERLVAMLDHEYKTVTERLHEKRGQETKFFAFANTVRARAFADKEGAECHGWLGIRFMTRPEGSANEVLLHVRMFDPSNLEQQRHLGILGVNLVHACFNYADDLETFVSSLLDELTHRTMEIDLLKFTGPDFPDVDNRMCALLLVEKNLTDAAFFNAAGEVMQVAEKLYKKPVVVLRGSFNPVTNVHIDMLESAGKSFKRTLSIPEGKTEVPQQVEIMEFSMNNFFAPASELTHSDFLQRASILQAMGKNVLISKFNAFHRLAAYLSRYTSEPIALVLSLDVFEKLFHEKYYEELPGGILESLGRLFKNLVRLYVYPILERETEDMRVVQEARIPDHLRNLFDFLMDNKKLVSLAGGASREALLYWTTEVRKMMDEGNEQWKHLVPQAVVDAFEAGNYK